MGERASNMTATDDLFVFVSAVLVLLMHVGFSMLEVGCVQPKNRSSILLKNLMCLTVGGISWWALGYLLATGVNMSTQSAPGFLGKSDGSDTIAFLADLEKTGTNYIGWFFGFAFAATAATIVSGAVAERIQYRAFFILISLITGFVYPVVAYWGWGSNGWLKMAGNDVDVSKGYLDFAGSGLVHMVGGCAALVAIIILGPREKMTMANGDIKPRFEDDGSINTPGTDGASLPFCALGTLILWVGWYGFNCGSVLAVNASVGIAAVNTTLAPCAAVVTYALMAGLLSTHVDVAGALNATLTGLVAITANANYVESWAAVLIGAIATPVYIGSSWLLKRLKLDDVIDAIPVHYFGGLWGVLATGLFVSDDIITDGHDAGLFYDGSGLIGWQICGIIAISAWTAVFTALACVVLLKVGWLRLDADHEEKGMDLLMQELSQQTGQQTVTTPDTPRRKEKATTEASPVGSLDLEAPSSKNAATAEFDLSDDSKKAPAPAPAPASAPEVRGSVDNPLETTAEVESQV